MAADIRAAEAEAAGDRDLLGGEVDEEVTALVRAGAVLLGLREQLVRRSDNPGFGPLSNTRATPRVSR